MHNVISLNLLSCDLSTFFFQLSGVIKTVPENVFTSLQFGDNYIDVSLSGVQGCEQLRKPVSG